MINHNLIAQGYCLQISDTIWYQSVNLGTHGYENKVARSFEEIGAGNGPNTFRCQLAEQFADE